MSSEAALSNWYRAPYRDPAGPCDPVEPEDGLYVDRPVAAGEGVPRESGNAIPRAAATAAA